MICVSLGNITLSEALVLCGEVPMVEIRADLLHWHVKDYISLIQSGVKTVFTCRPGVYSGQERKNLFESAASAGADYLDIEYDSHGTFLDHALKIKRSTSSELILSYHDYEKTPGQKELQMILEDCYIKGADVAKIACRVNTNAELARLLSLYEIDGRKVVLGMGNKAKITRIAALYMGSEFTFASPAQGNETAEGQIDYKTLQEITRLINKI